VTSTTDLHIPLTRVACGLATITDARILRRALGATAARSPHHDALRRIRQGLATAADARALGRVLGIPVGTAAHTTRSTQHDHDHGRRR